MRIFLIIMLSIVPILSACQDEKLASRSPSKKNIIMIMVDSMTNELLEETLNSDDFPAFFYV